MDAPQCWLKINGRELQRYTAGESIKESGSAE
jgi:hypothetical protein